MQNHRRGMETMTKFVGILKPKITQILANLFGQSPQISQKDWDIIEKQDRRYSDPKARNG